MRRLLPSLAALATAILCAACSPALAQTFRYDNIRPGAREVSVLTGYGENHRIPTLMRNRFSFDELKFRVGRFVSPRAQTALEIAATNQITHGRNWALSSVISHRRNFLVRGSMALGYDLGFGFVRFFNHVPELGTKINFTEQLGLSLQYATGVKSAFIIEYKFCHISNAGIKTPNIGLNASTFSLGHSWYK